MLVAVIRPKPEPDRHSAETDDWRLIINDSAGHGWGIAGERVYGAGEVWVRVEAEITIRT